MGFVTTMATSIRWMIASTLLLPSLIPAVAAAAQYGGGSSGKLPVVDLGYERQRATLVNETGGYYNFSNIRYAAPPTGNLRFRAPEAPARNRGQVQTGTQGRICAQADPAWILIAEQ